MLLERLVGLQLLTCHYNVCTLVGVSELRFEWDAAKSRANERKHGVSFDEAETVFVDENGLLIDDSEHSEEEERFVLLGLSAKLRMLLVCHCYREDEDLIRIISARKATKPERDEYNQRLRS